MVALPAAEFPACRLQVRLRSCEPRRLKTEASMAQRKIETGTNDLLGSIEDGVATLTMNRPERRNALSGAMLSALSAALVECESDPDVAVVVLTGAGGGFCAGGDV